MKIKTNLQTEINQAIEKGKSNFTFFDNNELNCVALTTYQNAHELAIKAANDGHTAFVLYDPLAIKDSGIDNAIDIECYNLSEEEKEYFNFEYEND